MSTFDLNQFSFDKNSKPSKQWGPNLRPGCMDVRLLAGYRLFTTRAISSAEAFLVPRTVICTTYLWPRSLYVFKLADLHIKLLRNITNSKRIYIFSKIKGIFVIINNFTCRL